MTEEELFDKLAKDYPDRYEDMFEYLSAQDPDKWDAVLKEYDAQAKAGRTPDLETVYSHVTAPSTERAVEVTRASGDQSYQAEQERAAVQPNDKLFDKLLERDQDGTQKWLTMNVNDLASWAQNMGFNMYNQPGVPTSGINREALKLFMNELRDRGTPLARQDAYAQDNPVSALYGKWLAPRQMEDIAQGRDPSWRSLLGDLGSVAVEAAPFGIPGGGLARAGASIGKIGKLLGAAAGYVGANAAAPLIEETYDALAYQDEENAERANFNWGDVMQGTAVNAGTPLALRMFGAGAGRIFGARGFGDRLANLGVDPASKQLVARQKLSDDLANFEKFNEASGTNIKRLSGKWTDPLSDEEFFRYNVPGEKEYTKMVFDVPDGVTVPSIDEARKLSGAQEAMQNIDAGFTKVEVDPKTRRMTIVDGEKAGPDTKTYAYQDGTSFAVPYNAKKVTQDQLDYLQKLGVVPMPSLAERAASMAPGTLVTNKLGQSKYGDNAMQRLDPTSLLPLGDDYEGVLDMAKRKADEAHAQDVKEARWRAGKPTFEEQHSREYQEWWARNMLGAY